MDKKKQVHYSKELISRYLESPREYKICLVCKTIIERGYYNCPHCYAYRFDDNEENVINHALTLATQPKSTISLDDRYED